MAQKWHKEAEKAREEMERQLREQERTRRPSRFEVIPAPDILKMQRQSVNDLTMSANNNGGGSDHVSHAFVRAIDFDVTQWTSRFPSRFAPHAIDRSIHCLLPRMFQHTFHSPVFGSQPKKSILKKTNSFTLKGFSPLVSPAVTPYTTVTGAESR